MSQLGELFQESECSQPTDLNSNNSSSSSSRRRRSRSSTIMGLLRERLEGAQVVGIRTSIINSNNGRRSSSGRFKLLKGFGCCRVTWWDCEEDTPEEEAAAAAGGSREASAAASPGMNLGAALAAERQWRDGIDASPMRVSLMRLLEETALFDDDINNNNSDINEKVCCCVCMGREKGAALVPCGHTFCRVCSRELWLNRGSCPLCNRSILDILDIF